MMYGVKKSLYTTESLALQSLLRKIRDDAGLTQAEMATRLGVNQSWVSYYERGSRKLDMLQVRKICLAVGIPLPEFAAMLEQAIAENGH